MTYRAGHRVRATRAIGGALLASTALTAAAPGRAQAAQSVLAAPNDAAPAQTEGARVSATQDSPGDIIVTATKRSERLQDVPISIQALSTATLEQHQVASFDDYAKLLPSVSYQSFGPSQSQLFFRGISSAGDGLHAGSLPTSGLYLDEVPLTTIANNVDLHVYDMARVEALSGPQGTLFGASSLSGTLRLITNKPDTSKFSAGYDLQGNKFGDGKGGGLAEGYANIPLSDRAAIRLVGFYEHDGGYIDNVPQSRTYQRPHTVQDPAAPDDPDATVVVNSPLTVNNARYVKKDFNDVDTYGGRAALKYDIDDNWTATPTIIYQHQRTHGAFLFDPKRGDLAVSDFSPDRTTDKWYQAALTIQGKLGNWDVVYAGGYFERRVDTVADYSYYTVAYDASPDYTYFTTPDGAAIDPTQTYHTNDKYTKQTHELRVSSPSGERFRLVAGAFLQRQTDLNVADYIIPGLSGSAQQSQVSGAGDVDDIYYTHVHRIDRDYAMFGEAAFDILPNLTLNAGIRGFIAKNTLAGFSGFASANTCGGQAADCPNIDKRHLDSGETHKVNLTWKIDRDHMVYATYSTGFRPGGSNRKPTIRAYNADKLSNYELGFKTSWLDHRLRINGAIFMEDWDKLQYGLAPLGAVGVTYTYNAGNARVKGVEGDVSWRIGDHLTLSGAGTYIDAKLRTNFCNLDENNNILPDCAVADGNVSAPKGTRLPIQPRLKINGTARYDFAIGDFKTFLQGVALHQSGTRTYLSDSDAAILGPTSGFTTFDFSGGIAHANLTLELFIQNAFDKRGILSKNTVCVPDYCGAFARDYPIKPQIFGIKVGQRF